MQHVPFCNLTKQYALMKTEIDSVLKNVLADGQYILGKYIRKFEEEFAEYCNAQHAIAVSNGTDAITIALRGLGIQSKDEVITVANTCMPTICAIENAGGMPVFVDIKSDYMIDEKLILSKITKKNQSNNSSSFIWE